MKPRRGWRRLATRLLAAMLLAVSVATPATAAEPSQVSSLVPLAITLGPAPTPLASEGLDHLLHELRLTNFAPRAVTLTALDIVDPDSGTILLRAEGQTLAGLVATPGRNPDHGALTILPGGFVVLHLDAPVPHGTAPRRLRHIIEVAGDARDLRRTRLEGPVIAVGREPPLKLSAPLTGAGWLAANALSNEADHRRTIAVVDGLARLAQRYAIDFVQLDANGRAFVGDPKRNESWAGYGAPVLAAADGVVEAVRDGLPDNQPLAPPLIPIDLDSIGGNHVVVRLPKGQHIFYGHLQPGSIRVRPGQRVAVGHVLGALGNSGQSDAPHLHIHVADGASPLGAEGLPFVFSRFLLEGHVPSLDVLEDPRGWQRQSGTVTMPRQRELPAANAVIAF